MKMQNKCDIGIIGAMEPEVMGLIGALENRTEEKFGSVSFFVGDLYGKRVVVTRCGIGKVFAAIATEAMIVRYSPRLVVNTGVGGAIDPTLRPLDVVFADRLVQHDMDTSALGDPKGLVSGINVIYFNSDPRAIEILSRTAAANSFSHKVGTVATGDRFVCDMLDKRRISTDFGASVCEMEGCAVAQTAFVNDTPFVVVRAISDSADGSAEMEYSRFLPEAARISTALTLALVREY